MPSEAMTENGLKQSIMLLASENGWCWFTLPQARQVRPNKAVSGYPDMTFARDGEILWMELKAEKGEQSPKQRMWQEALRPFCHVIRPSDWHSGRVHELLA